MRFVKRLLLITLVLVVAASAKSKQAPLSPAFAAAKTVCLYGPVDSINQMFAELQEWGRYKVVADCDAADLVIGTRFGDGATAMVVADKRGEDATILYQDVTYSRGLLNGRSATRVLIKKLRKRIESTE